MKRRTRILIAAAIALAVMLARPRHAGDDGPPPRPNHDNAEDPTSLLTTDD